MSQDFALQVVKGANIGKTWRLSSDPLTLGRSTDCSVRIVDATISRRHCEVWVDSAGPHLRDLGSSNATLLNGKAVHDADLKEGDEIALGPYTLRVVLVVQPEQPVIQPVDQATPATVALSDAFFIQEPGAEATGVPVPVHLTEFRELLRINREFARCAKVVDLVTVLGDILKRRFEPESWWLVRASGTDRKLVPHPMAGDASSEAIPATDIQRALAIESGFLVPRRRLSGERPSIETTLIAPLILAEERIGALAVRAAMPRRVYDESDLEFFLALAHTFTPYLRAAEQTEQLRRDVARLRDQAGVSTALIGASEAMKEVRDMAGRAAKSDLPVLVLGETGTGKELVARMIHDLSPRAANSYVVVNAAAIPRELFESEMFGYEKGAFTGAARQKSGHFEEAHSGTLFLDEVGDLSLENQARILRVIETGRFYRVGGTREVSIDARIVSATNRTLDDERNGAFRSDLYHRLSGFVISLPPLRKRKSDIPELVEHFLRNTQRAASFTVRALAPEALEKLKSYDWPGNVRELRSCVERAAALAQNEFIEADDIVLPRDGKSDSDSGAYLLTLADAERHHIMRVLKRHQGNIRSAAQSLKISRVTLYKKINDYGINV